MKTLDPSFSMESFKCELREYIVPEVVDAYLRTDNDVLKSWCSEAVRTSQPTKRAVALIDLILFFLLLF
jgi:hypothetical protein